MFGKDIMQNTLSSNFIVFGRIDTLNFIMEGKFILKVLTIQETGKLFRNVCVQATLQVLT